MILDETLRHIMNTSLPTFVPRSSQGRAVPRAPRVSSALKPRQKPATRPRPHAACVNARLRPPRAHRTPLLLLRLWGGRYSCRMARFAGAGVLVVAFAVYMLNGRSIASGDTVPASLIPIALLVDGTVRLDRFVDEIYRNPAHWYIVRTPRGAV